jgi:aspartate dehydrogenase
VAEPVAFYEGPARAAARDYPKNANVAAAVALAGVGFERTRVRLIADPGAAGNCHEIVMRSACADAIVSINGRASPANPKTSLTTGYSPARVVLNQTAVEVI